MILDQFLFFIQWCTYRRKGDRPPPVASKKKEEKEEKQERKTKGKKKGKIAKFGLAPEKKTGQVRHCSYYVGI